MDGQGQFWILLGIVVLTFAVLGVVKHVLGMRCPNCRKLAVKTVNEEVLPGRRGPLRIRSAVHTGQCGYCGQTFRRTVAKMPKSN